MRDKLLLTMSSSGGKWLASTLAKHIPNCRYYDKEFFNPWCNPKREQTLMHNFGCEMASCYRNIALPGDTNIERDIEETWCADGYTFTKEVFSAFKLPTLMKFFDVFALVRRTEDCLPPKRSNVWNCYEHTWCALREAGFRLPGSTGRDRARVAHSFMRRKIMEDCERLALPVLQFDFLQDASPAQLYDAFGFATGHTSRELVDQITASRYRE
jgi:hypothetical protein